MNKDSFIRKEVDCVRIRLFRLANIFNPSLISNFFLLLAVIIIFLIYNKFKEYSVLSGTIVLAIHPFLYSLNYPKYIEFNGNNINYATLVNGLRKYGGGNFISIKVKYHITDITDFSLKQNKIERLLGLAHVVFTGKTTLDAGKYTDEFRIKDTHCVYGIIKKKHINNIASFVKELPLLDK